MNSELILLDIFSYSCMNCLRSLEYIKKLDLNYRRFGLKTIIIHPPEWKFEKNRNNVLYACKKHKINMPVIMDKDRKMINKLKINFWPTQILVRNGKILYTHVGEGNYKKLEGLIIKNLKVKGKKIFLNEPKYSKFPTLYCGKKKWKSIKIGKWIQKNECIQSTKNDAKITIKTKGNVTNFVAESLTKKPVLVKIMMNNEFNKNIKINKPRLYKLIKTNSSKTHRLTIISPKNLAIYSFSFQ